MRRLPTSKRKGRINRANLHFQLTPRPARGSQDTLKNRLQRLEFVNFHLLAFKNTKTAIWNLLPDAAVRIEGFRYNRPALL